MATTQPRAFGPHAGAPYGDFSGRAVPHDVGLLTQCRASGAGMGMRYGSFAGRTPAAGRILSQSRAFGAFTGARYGSFAGRNPAPPTPPSPDGVLEPKLLGRSRANRQRLREEEQQRMDLARQIVVLAIAQVIASEVLDE